MLPRVKIAFLAGALGLVGESPDGLVALAVGAAQVSETFALGKPYTLRRTADLIPLGLSSANNPLLVRHVQDFYAEAPEGTELVIYGVPKSQTLTQLCNKQSGLIANLILQAGGRLRAVLLVRDAEVGAATAGLEADVLTALPLAQQLAQWAAEDQYAPLVILLEGRGLSTKTVKDLSSEACDRVGVVVGDTISDSHGACMGLLAGRIARTSVQRHIGRVQDGALASQKMYLAGSLIEEHVSLLEELHAKRYIYPRTYVGRTGYYLADDHLASAGTGDYAQLAHRRVIDKAYRIAYNTLLDYMLDEIELNPDGTMLAPVLKAWEAAVRTAINREMTARGELSPGADGGCRCRINPLQNVVATSRIEITLQVRPHGYARYIDVSLGFQVYK